MILVTGATGTVGRELVAELARRGGKVRALSRRPPAATFPADVETVSADLGRPETLTPALAGVERVFVLATGPARLARDQPDHRRATGRRRRPGQAVRADRRG